MDTKLIGIEHADFLTTPFSSCEAFKVKFILLLLPKAKELYDDF